MRKLTIVVGLLLLFAAPLAWSQTLSGTVAGSVKDEQGGALPGVSVTLTGKTGAKTSVTDAGGEYRFVGVDPGTYTVTAELSGFRTKRQAGVVVLIGKTVDVHLSLGVGGLEETVEVIGESPVVDTTTSATDNNLSQDMLFNLPIRPGNAATSLLNYLPGVNNGSAYGGDSDTANGLLLDGVDTRDPEGGSAWTFFNFNIIEEVQVSGLGAPAEFGAFTGAVVNTITKSGGNRYMGLFDAYYTNDSLAGNNVSADQIAQNPSLDPPSVYRKWLDMTAQLGGPLVKDKLFFFASAQRFERQQDPSGPLDLRKEVSPRLNLKLTWQPTPNDNLIGTFQSDDYNIIGRCGPPLALCNTSLTNREDAPEYVWGAQWRHLFGSKTFLEIKYNGWTGYYDLNPEVNQPGIFDGATGLYSQSQGWFYYADRGRNQVNASLSHYAEAFGRHDLKFGVEVERSRVRNRYGYTNDIFYYDYSSYYPSKQYYAYDYGYDFEGKNQRESFYAQDSWKPNDRLTINAGVRFDWVRGYPSGVSGNGPNGTDKVYDTKNWAPRIGFAWDIAGDGKTVLKGHYGQYYEGAFTYAWSSAIPGIEDFVGYLYDPDGDVCGPAGNCFFEVNRAPTPLYQVDPNIKHPRVDELTAGFERAVGKDVRLAVTGIWRKDKNLQGSVIPSARWAPVSVDNEVTGQPLTVYTWVNRSESEEDKLLTNPDGFRYFDSAGNLLGTAESKREYKALMFVLDKRLSNNWIGRVSYVYAKAEGTQDNDGFDSYGASSLYESPSRSLVNRFGPLTNDPTHELKVYLGYQVPSIDLNINGYWRTISGRTWTPYEQFSSRTINYSPSSGRRVLLEPAGSRRNDTENVLDVRVEKVFKFGGNDRLAVYADFNNIFNNGAVYSSFSRYPSTSVPLPGGTGETADVEVGAPGTIIQARQIYFGARFSF
jgi:outer membrane receptor protein involved in Fe transport